MRIKSSVLLGLILVICAISGFSLLKRLTQEVDEWRPSNLYSSTNVSRRSTFSVVSSAPASYSEAVASVSSGSGSMFRHRAVSSYAPAVSAPASRLSPLASSPQGGLYTTSSAEFRSFGGGGNSGGVSMSGGSVKSSGSSVSTPSGLSISMPSTSVYAYNTNRNSVVVSNVVPSVSGDIAMASTQAYAGIGNTTGGASRRISGRKNGSVEDSWLQWLANNGTGYGSKSGDEENGWTYTFDYYQLDKAYQDYVTNYWEDMWGEPPTFEQWLLWFQGNGGSHSYRGDMYNWVPVGDYYPLLILAMLYVGYVAIRRRKSQISKNNN